MKAGLLAIAALSAVASAQPHRRHLQLHQERDVVVETAYQTQIEYATVTAPAAVVYVDQNGNPIQEAAPTSTPAPVASPEPASAPAAPQLNVAVAVDHGSGQQHAHERPADNQPATTAPAPTTTAAPQQPAYTPPAVPSPEPAPEPAPTTAAAPSVAAPAPVPEQPAYTAPVSSTPPATGGNGLGITYSPYNDDNSCKSADQVKKDIDSLQGGHQLIRLYGVDCNQIQNVIAAAKPHGYKLFLGIYDVHSAVSQAATLASAVKGSADWSMVDTVSVGNEGVNNGQYSVADVGIAVAATKAALLVAGYTGPVITVDTFTAIINNPGLCAVGDYVGANCHAYFDGGYAAENAGDFVLSQAQRVSAACGGKKVVITESGWPSAGDANQKAIASPANQQAAINSISSKFSNNLILFNAYNDGWKKDSAATLNAERHWGIFGNAPSQ